MGAKDSLKKIVILLDKIDVIGKDRFMIEMKSLGLNAQSINILNQFIEINNITDLQDLLKNSKLGTEGFNELIFIKNNVDKVGLQSSELFFDITLARGLDYYTGCIIEAKSMDVNIGSIGGGGRYDDLTSIFGLNDISGVGIFWN